MAIEAPATYLYSQQHDPSIVLLAFTAIPDIIPLQGGKRPVNIMTLLVKIDV